MTNLSDLERANKPVDSRVLRFSSKVHVCLIPTRKDLKSSHDDLYWKPEDYSTFKTEAVVELKAMLQALGLTAKQAITALYQPSETDRLEEEALLKGVVLPSRSAPDKFYEEDYESDWKELKVFSDDEDVAILDQKFITGIKTDVEMNNPNGDAKGDFKLPSRTPAGNSVSNQAAWAVAWVPAAATATSHKPPAHNQQHRSLSQ